MKSTIIKYFVGITTISLAFIYLIYIYQNNSNLIDENLENIGWYTLAGAITFSSLGGVLNATLWHIINIKNDITTKFSTSYSAWSIGRIYRYIPGKVAGFYVRNKLQKSTSTIGVISSINEVIISLIPILVLTAVYLCIYTTQYFYLLYIIPITLFILNIKVIIKRIDSLNVYSTKFEQYFQSPQQVIKTLPIVIPAMIFHSISLYIIINFGLKEQSFNIFFALIILYISGIIGQLSLISPGGIGVREAAIVILLSNIGINHDIALSAAILSRLVLIISEILNVLFSSLIKKMEST